MIPAKMLWWIRGPAMNCFIKANRPHMAVMCEHYFTALPIFLIVINKERERGSCHSKIVTVLLLIDLILMKMYTY